MGVRTSSIFFCTHSKTFTTAANVSLQSCFAVCCSACKFEEVLQCFAVRCSLLQHVAVCSVYAFFSNLLQCSAPVAAIAALVVTRVLVVRAPAAALSTQLMRARR